MILDGFVAPLAGVPVVRLSAGPRQSFELIDVSGLPVLGVFAVTLEHSG